MTINQAFRLFLDDQYIKGNSLHTITDYTNKLRPFLKQFGERELAELRSHNLNEYARHLRETHSNSVTIQSYVRALRAFLNWLYLGDYVEADFCRKFRLPKARKPLINILTDTEIERVFAVYGEDSNVIHLRNRVILSLMLDAGLRLNEVVTAQITDLHLPEGYLIVTGKGSKQRAVSFGVTTLAHLKVYLEAASPSQALLQNADGKPLTSSTLKNMFRKLKKKSGVSRLHPHLLRHTFATRYLENGGTIYNLKELLGHTTLKQTQQYLHLSRNLRHLDFNKFSPLDNMKKHSQH
ncbi:MAG: tyrosine-type recombinase/integrase [Clostridia bacterium]|nr:tyrosine-type recombinase/integrase [Clostridia bacterium]